MPAAVFALSTTLLWLLRPLVVSGDGVGYIKRLISPERDIVPGHLVYIPLLEQLRLTLLPDGGHSAAAVLATFFSALGGGAACGMICWLANRLTSRSWPGIVAALGLGASFGFYRASGDVEAYAPAVATLVASACLLLPPADARRLGWGRVAAAGALLGLTTMLHTSLVLFTPFVAYAAWRASRSWPKTVATVAIGGAVSLASFLGVAMLGLGHDVGEAVAWIRTSDNGYAQPPSLSLSFILHNLGRLAYGVGRTFVHSPQPDRLGVRVSMSSSALGMSYVAAFLAVLWLGLRSTPASLRHQLRPLWAWLVPLVLFGFLFFPAATERWVLVLPCLWLTFAVALPTMRWPRPWVAPALTALAVVVPLAANVVIVGKERDLDRRTLDRSRAISELLRPGDLLLYPGHTWDEYIGFYEDAEVERFILASFAGEEQGDRDAFLARLRRDLESTFDQGGRVIAVRVFDPPGSHHGWSLLRALGVSRDDVLILLSDYRAEQRLSSPVGVWEIRRAASPRDASARR